MATKFYKDGSDNYRVSIPGSTEDAVLPAGFCTLIPNADGTRVTIAALNGALWAIAGDYAVNDLTNSGGTPYADYDTLVAAVGSFFRKPLSGGGGDDIDAWLFVNITNWNEFIALAPFVDIGYRVIYNNNEYRNLTGVITATAPDLDTTNWILTHISLEYVYHVAENGSDTLGDGSIISPFATGQHALDVIGDAADTAEYEDENINRRYLKYAPGKYVENLTIPQRNIIIIEFQGAVLEGDISYTVDSSLGGSSHPATLILQGSSLRGAHSSSSVPIMGVDGNVYVTSTGTAIVQIMLINMGIKKEVQIDGPGGSKQLYTNNTNIIGGIKQALTGVSRLDLYLEKSDTSGSSSINGIEREGGTQANCRFKIVKNIRLTGAVKVTGSGSNFLCRDTEFESGHAHDFTGNTFDMDLDANSAASYLNNVPTKGNETYFFADQAQGIGVDPANFVNMFTSADNTSQKAFETVDLNTLNNENIINDISKMPAPVDLGDGLGLAYRFKNNVLGFGKDISLPYPIAPTAAAEDFVIITHNKITYTGTGSFIRINATNKWTRLRIYNARIHGDGTNQAFDIVGTGSQVLEFLSVGFENFGSLGNINIQNTVLMNVATFNNFKDQLVLNGNVVNFIGITGMNPQYDFGASLIAVLGSSFTTAITSSQIIATGGNSAFYIDPGHTGFVDITRSNVIGTAFGSGSLTQTDPKIIANANRGIPDSQTIGSYQMERNTNPTVITATGVNGDITAIADGETTGSITVFADGGGGQVTVTSVAHGLTTGDEVVISGTTNYNGTFIIANTLTDTFEITATWVSDDATGTWVNYKSIITSTAHGKANGEVVWILDDNDYYSGKYIITNATTNTFDIAKLFASTSTGIWEDNWVKVAGITLPMENERAEMSDNNEVCFFNFEEQSVTIIATINPKNDTIAATKDWEFCMMKNNTRLKGSLRPREMTDKVGGDVISCTTSVVNEDCFSIYVRNILDTTNMIMVGMTNTISK